MDADEVVLLIIFAIASWSIWRRWYACILSVTQLASTLKARWLVPIAPAVCWVLLLVILRLLSSQDVRDDSLYLLFYLLMGAAWLGIAVLIFPFWGLSARDDAIERQNPAASTSISGALLGVTLCFAGGNIGNGPGWWTVVYSAFLSTSTWFLLWFCLELVTRISETITIDRDRASGWRLAGFLVALGLVLGWAVAGDWESFTATTIDFVILGWPALVLTAVAAMIETVCQPTAKRPILPVATHGLIPSVFYLGSAILCICVWGGSI